MSGESEPWRPSSVVVMVVFGILALGVMGLVVAEIAIELWGKPLFDIVGTFRRVPVWVAWIASALLLAAGADMLWTSCRALYQAARGRRSRVPSTREGRRLRDLERKREYDERHGVDN